MASRKAVAVCLARWQSAAPRGVGVFPAARPPPALATRGSLSFSSSSASPKSASSSSSSSSFSSSGASSSASSSEAEMRGNRRFRRLLLTTVAGFGLFVCVRRYLSSDAWNEKLEWKLALPDAYLPEDPRQGWPPLPTAEEQARLRELWKLAVTGISLPANPPSNPGVKADEKREDEAGQSVKVDQCDANDARVMVRLMHVPDNELTTRKIEEIPPWMKEGVWFVLTAWNPMGQEAPSDRNVVANRVLRYSFPKLVPPLSPKPNLVVRSRGIDLKSPWFEDGFAVRFDRKDADAAERIMVKMGHHFGQAAIYRYEWASEAGAMRQQVVPCRAGLDGVRSDVNMYAVRFS